MTNKMENKLSMYLAVQKVTNSNADVWSDLPAFKRNFNEYEGVLQKIKAVRLVQEKRLQVQQKTKRRQETK
jgi:hypothetical protein